MKIWMCALLLLIPAASAQAVNEYSISLPTVEPISLNEGQTYTLPVNVTIGCGLIVSEGGSVDIDFTTTLPDHFGVSTPSLTVSALTADCLTGSGELEVVHNLTVKPPTGTMGQRPTEGFQVQASINGSSPETALHDQVVVINYREGHTITLDQTFPANVTGPSLKFNVTIDVTANARTMVMFLGQNVHLGKVSGLELKIFDVANGQTQAVVEVTYTPPLGKWTTDYLTFENVSHCLTDSDGTDCGKNNQFRLSQNYNWTFVNGQPAVNDPAPEKKSPGIGVFAIVAVGIALLLRRR